jgi:hypothetical protein
MHVAGLKVDTPASTTPEWTPGTVAATFDGTSYKVYKYVMYDDGDITTDGVAGEVAYYLADTGYAAHTVTSDLTASSEVGAGVLQVDMVTQEYAWIQIKGVATLTIALSADTDGAPLTPTGGADGTLDDATAATDHICAVTINGGDKLILCDFPY